MSGSFALLFADLDECGNDGGGERSCQDFTQERRDQECDDERVKLVAGAEQVSADHDFRGAGELHEYRECTDDHGIRENFRVAQVQLVI